MNQISDQFQIILLPNTTNYLPSFVLEFINSKHRPLILTSYATIYKNHCPNATTIVFPCKDNNIESFIHSHQPDVLIVDDCIFPEDDKWLNKLMSKNNMQIVIIIQFGVANSFLNLIRRCKIVWVPFHYYNLKPNNFHLRCIMPVSFLGNEVNQQNCCMISECSGNHVSFYNDHSVDFKFDIRIPRRSEL